LNVGPITLSSSRGGMAGILGRLPALSTGHF
jgi:hypothetical protein